jgi:hypothetical protein
MPWVVNECGRRGAIGAGLEFLAFIDCVTRSSCAFEIWPAAPRCHIGPVRQIATDAAIAGKPAHGLLTGGLYG